MASRLPTRRAMQERTVEAVRREAAARGAWAGPVFRHDGKIGEVFLYRGGGLVASIFTPKGGRIGIWRPSGEALANTVKDAVKRALDPLRKHTRKEDGVTEICAPPGHQIYQDGV